MDVLFWLKSRLYDANYSPVNAASRGHYSRPSLRLLLDFATDQRRLMHVEHIIPVGQGGTSDESNLWLACAWCNSYKAAKTHAVDPATGVLASLFNPRTHSWSEHFRWSDDGVEIVGQTPTGRATVAALQMNNPYTVPARRQWASAGWHPPRL